MSLGFFPAVEFGQSVEGVGVAGEVAVLLVATASQNDTRQFFRLGTGGVNQSIAAEELCDSEQEDDRALAAASGGFV